MVLSKKVGIFGLVTLKKLGVTSIQFNSGIKFNVCNIWSQRARFSACVELLHLDPRLACPVSVKLELRLTGAPLDQLLSLFALWSHVLAKLKC